MFSRKSLGLCPHAIMPSAAPQHLGVGRLSPAKWPETGIKNLLHPQIKNTGQRVASCGTRSLGGFIFLASRFIVLRFVCMRICGETLLCCSAATETNKQPTLERVVKQTIEDGSGAEPSPEPPRSQRRSESTTALGAFRSAAMLATTPPRSYPIKIVWMIVGRKDFSTKESSSQLALRSGRPVKLCVRTGRFSQAAAPAGIPGSASQSEWIDSRAIFVLCSTGAD